jgi:nicotinamide phosphoribosyltransferase
MRLLRRLDDGSLHTVPLPANGDDTLPDGFEDAMVTVWENGRLLHDQRLDDIRTRAGGMVMRLRAGVGSRCSAAGSLP